MRDGCRTLELPRLAGALQQQQQQQAEVAARWPQLPVSWADVSHWMWPLFTQRWGPWRQEALALQQLPLLAAWQQAWQGCTFSSSSSSSSSSSGADGCRQGTQQQPQQQVGEFADLKEDRAAAAAAAVEGGENLVGAQLPGSVPVLYGLSPAVVSQPGYWPGSVQLTGFWLAADMHSQPAWQQQQQQQGCRLPAPLQKFLSAHHQQQSDAAGNADEGLSCPCDSSSSRRGLLLVDFGSMGCLGLLREPELLLQVLLQALTLLDWCGVLVTGGWQPLADAYAALNPQPAAAYLASRVDAACRPGVRQACSSMKEAIAQEAGLQAAAAAVMSYCQSLKDGSQQQQQQQLLLGQHSAAR
ncbi:hypothetical protein OEZ85_003423 [Tetradesmus obliquus]|uniref:Uncharacterized protein n=1 Tax=Tetradesmus obliquus TaxID=3088 RepID=A0ABY8UBG6_TETOB|nr:hypothetical protein OEZ85_003423 [Tetradesmus obliquus]